jgi:hypothetical protein
MTSALCLVALLSIAAPAPADGKDKGPETVKAPTGPAPRLLFVKAGADGKVRLAAHSAGNFGGGVVAVQIQVGGAGGAPGAPPQIIQRAFAGGAAPVELKDLKDVTITTTSGAKIDVAEATKRLTTGGFVLVPSDGKAIAPEWLRLFRGDGVLVVTSPDLVASGNAGGFQIAPAWAVPQLPAPVPVPAPAPAPKN